MGKNIYVPSLQMSSKGRKSLLGKLFLLMPAAVIFFGLDSVSAQQVGGDVYGFSRKVPNAHAQQGQGYEPIRIRGSATGAGTFNSGMIFIADQIDRNVNPDVRQRPTVITTFADLNNLGQSSSLGRMVGEHLLHELQIRGWNVTDVRLTRDLIVNDSGEFSLSRDMKLLREAFPLSNVVTGTYSTTKDGVLLNLRVIDSQSGRIMSTAQTRFIQDSFISDLIREPVNYPSVRLRRACPDAAPCSVAR